MGVSITPWPRLPPGKEPPVPIGQEAGWASLNAETRRKILCLCRGSNPGRAVCSQSLYWLSYVWDFLLDYREIHVETRDTEVPCWSSLWMQRLFLWQRYTRRLYYPWPKRWVWSNGYIQQLFFMWSSSVFCYFCFLLSSCTKNSELSDDS
jgi:hypothetical protein